jgi:hypothetical protein
VHQLSSHKVRESRLFKGSTEGRKTIIDVAIIGAGPYGLSLAAHLRARGVNLRVFGSPMHTWLTQMPKGMRLKSDGFASSLYDPGASLTLGRYCEDLGLPYADVGIAVPLETFAAYGLEFQRRFVPELENNQVISLDRSSSGFEIVLDNGVAVTARKVVVAAGISHYQYLPPVFAGLPVEFVTHTSGHTTFEEFRGREVTVVGAGASAIDVAAALLQAGAVVQIVARAPVIHFHDPPKPFPRPLLDRVRFPMTGLGPGWRSLMCTRGPLLFRLMPEKFRLEVVRRHLGPAPGWFIRDEVVGRVPFHLGFQLDRARIAGGRVELDVTGGAGERKTFVADHLIAGTGYRVDLKRLGFLKPSILAGIRSVDSTPALSSNFESSVPDLYFVGAASANTFGPMVRFAYGAGFTSRRLSNHLSRLSRRQLVSGVAMANLKTTQGG